ncbi:MAG: carboxymuconolactone decarboxylase family protein [Bacteroidales bacterium]|nr:carboxymuconolactone decarboxylase family protein [Bacteroidales bacterium]
MALAIGITSRCEGCIACHVQDAIKAGATHEEIVETIGVAVLMGGGPSIVYGDKAYKAMQEMM